ncbi:MAG: riboflavin synthase [Chthoniobacterales bacterium]|nr:riboflavin synthase [Chthoniobacterales bacterium]
MFTGLIEETGTVISTPSSGCESRLEILAPGTARKARPGESVAVNGCCLTVASRRGHRLAFDLLEETVARTNLKVLQPDDTVNLERALPATGRLGGHFVQGHVDCVSSILAFDRKGADCRLEIALPDEFARYVAHKGSVAVNGISLTVAEVSPRSFAVWIVPYTRQHTNLEQAKAGDLVNLEFDVLAKYVERLLAARS